MKLAIIGYGKMGKEIARIAKNRGHEIPLIIDVNNASDLNRENLKDIDVAIEFSSPDAAKEKQNTAFLGNVAFKELWQQLNDEICQFCGKTTIDNLVELERAKKDSSVLTYNI